MPRAESCPDGDERAFRQGGTGTILGVILVFHGWQKPSHSRRAVAAFRLRRPVRWRTRR